MAAAFGRQIGTLDPHYLCTGNHGVLQVTLGPLVVAIGFLVRHSSIHLDRLRRADSSLLWLLYLLAWLLLALGVSHAMIQLFVSGGLARALWGLTYACGRYW